jgi:hypothetical protein
MGPRAELVRRGEAYCQRHGLTAGRQLGFGVHGIVFVAAKQIEPAPVAVKVHERELYYQRERDVYLRLQARSVTQLCGCEVPHLLRHDDELWVLEMRVVSPPFVLDFAGAYLDHAPDFPEDVLADWQAEKREQFGPRWADVQAILRELESLGIFLIDVSPNNITFA